MNRYLPNDVLKVHNFELSSVMATDPGTASSNVYVNSEYFLEMLNELKESTKCITMDGQKTKILRSLQSNIH